MKILISGPEFYNYNDAIRRGFLQSGYEARVSTWPDIWPPYIFPLKAFRNKKFQNLRNIILRNRIIKYNNSIKEKADEYNPDILLVLKGDIIRKETIEYINNMGIKTVLWCYDSIKKSPHLLDICWSYYQIYVFEKGDIPIFREIGMDVEFLPMGYDPTVYYKKEQSSTRADVCFVGNIYPDRANKLETIIKELPELDYEIHGNIGSWYNPIYQYRRLKKWPRLSEVINNGYVSPEKVNNIYNSTKICINLHNSQSYLGFNPRTAEILGAGGFEIVDNNPVIVQEFEQKEGLVTFEDTTELLDKIRYYLDSDSERKTIQQNGYKIAQTDHSFKNRAESIVRNI